jgi:hypothetical protein
VARVSRTRSSAALLLVGAALFVAAGCGGADAEAGEAEVEQVVRTFYGAVVDGDGAKACSLLAPRVRPTVPPQGSGHTCESAFSAFPHVLGADRAAQMRESLSHMALRVEVAGDSATVYVDGSSAGVPKDPGTLRLERAGDGWQITRAAHTG